MISKERVLRALKKKEGLPDRVPLQFDLCRQLTDEFGREMGIKPDYAISYYEDLTNRISANEIRTKLGSDVVVVGGTVAKDFIPEIIKDDIIKNEFGMYMKPTQPYVEVVKYPLDNAETIEDVENYYFPNPYAPGRFEKAKKDIGKYGKDFFVIGDVEKTIFELAWCLTGLEKYLLGIMFEELWVEKLNDKVEEWSTGIALQLVKAGVDAIWLGEYIGSRASSLISPAILRNLFKPRLKRMIEKLKQENPNIIIIMQSDGAVAPLIDDFIEIGIDVYNPIQPNVVGSDLYELKIKYGDSICFFGGIDQQNLLPNGDFEKLCKEMKLRIQILGKDRGYLLAPADILQANVSTKMVKEMIKTAIQYGNYK